MLWKASKEIGILGQGVLKNRFMKKDILRAKTLGISFTTYMRIELPNSVNQIIEKLQSRGYDAYAVGGCVRDSILGKKPHDWDITTSATPEQVKAVFSHTVDTGLQHGTVTVIIDKIGYEVTTYRIDGTYGDGRHPDSVCFTASLEEDLKRRDFTINAMAYNHAKGLVDCFNGQEDLRTGIIRAVGDAQTRFTEDALRMLRALRFAAQLGFTIDTPTYDAIRTLAPTIEKVSAERIQVELVKLVTSSHPEMIKEVYNTGLSRVFLPELIDMMECEQNTKHHCYTVGEHTIVALENIAEDKILRLTMLLHDVAKPACKTEDPDGTNHFKGHPEMGADMAKAILRRLKFDNATMDAVVRLVKYHDYRPELTKKAVRRAINKAGLAAYPAMFAVQRADTLAQSMYKRQEKLDYIQAYQKLYEEIISDNEAVNIKDLAVDGKDIIALGVRQGSEVGSILNQLLDKVLDEPELNKKEVLLDIVREIIGS